MHVIDIKGVSKGFVLGKGSAGKELPVLDKLSLSISKGEFVGIIGPNGCGKSTLFKMILGAEKPDNGEITILGQNPEKVQLGYVPQHSSGALYPWFTSTENLGFALQQNSNDSVQLISSKLNEFGVHPYADAFPYQLSGGLKQLISIARATLCSDIFLLDEPFSGLDYMNRLAVEKKLFEMRDGKNTILLISHDIESTILLCDKVVILTQKPTHIKAVLSISLPKNRTHSTRFDAGYQHILSQVYDLISD